MFRKREMMWAAASLATLLPVVPGLLFWKRLPDTVATSFGTDNAAKGFSGKAFAVFGIPLFCLAMLWLCIFILSLDPRKKNIGPGMRNLVIWLIPGVSWLGAAVIYPYNLGYRLDITSLMCGIFGVLFACIGFFLPATRQNQTVGVRVPWTLSSEENWKRTHRFAGRLWMAGGAALVVLALSGAAGIAGLTGIVLASTLLPCIYSYVLHRKGIG